MIEVEAIWLNPWTLVKNLDKNTSTETEKERYHHKCLNSQFLHTEYCQSYKSSRSLHCLHSLHRTVIAPNNKYRKNCVDYIVITICPKSLSRLKMINLIIQIIFYQAIQQVDKPDQTSQPSLNLPHRRPTINLSSFRSRKPRLWKKESQLFLLKIIGYNEWQV